MKTRGGVVIGLALVTSLCGLGMALHMSHPAGPPQVAMVAPAVDDSPDLDDDPALDEADENGTVFRERYTVGLKKQFVASFGVSAEAYVDRLRARLKADAARPMPVPSHLDPVSIAEGTVPEHPTYNQDVAPIIQQNCVSCHHDNSLAGPNARPLTEYRAVRRHALDVASTTRKHTMPPWGAAPGWGTFLGDRHLRQSDIQTIQRWVAQGCVEGTGVAPNPPRQDGTWPEGPPDLVLTLPPFTIPATGPGWYHYWVVPLPFDQDAAVANFDVNPGQHGIVHHCQMYLDTRGKGRELCHGDLQKGYAASSYFGPGFRPVGGLGGWAPGNLAVRPPEGAYFPVKAHSDLVACVHYMPDGKVEVARPQLALYLCKNPQRPMKNMVFVSGPLDVPAGNPHYVVRDHFTLPVATSIYMVKPHAHQLCTDIEAVATLPSGEVKPLVWTPNWDWSVQQAYRFAQPLHLPAETRIDFQWTFDNSAKNPHNPSHPPKSAHYGELDVDEMTLFSIAMSPERAEDLPRLERARTSRNYFPLLDPTWSGYAPSSGSQ